MKTIYFGQMEFIGSLCRINRVDAMLTVNAEVLNNVIDFFIEGEIYQEYVVVEDFEGTILM
jgi:hypothetical protein